MWEQNYLPVAGNLGYSTVVAAVPLLILFFMLGVKRKPSWIAGLSALASALVLAIGVFRDARTPSRGLDGLRCGFRPVPDWLDRHRLADPLPSHSRDWQVRDHQRLHRLTQRRS